MDFEFSTADEEFRRDLRQFLDEELPLGGGGCSLTTSTRHSIHPNNLPEARPTAVASTLLAARVRRCR